MARAENLLSLNRATGLDGAHGGLEPSLAAHSAGLPRSGSDFIDAAAGVTLRAAARRDLPAIVEQCRDPEMVRWTTVPTPPGGYQLRDAEEFLALTAAGWTTGQRLGWTIAAERTLNVASAAASISGSKATGSPRSASACILRHVAVRS